MKVRTPLALTIGVLKTICFGVAAPPSVKLVVAAPVSSVTYGFTPTGVATCVPLNTLTVMSRVALAVAPLLVSVLVALTCSVTVPVKPAGGVELKLARLQPVMSSVALFVPSVALRVPSLTTAPAGRPSSSIFSVSEPSVSARRCRRGSR